MWYRAGSVTVAAGSNVVTGAGTDFVANVSIGDAFVGQDGRSYEVGQIVSATDLRLTTPYQGAGGGGQAYAIQPTQSFARDLALAAAALLNTFGTVRDGVGQGLFPDGSVAAPAVRFSADQDTGLRRYAANVISAVCGGVDTALFGPDGTSFSVGGARIAQVLAAGLGLDTSKGIFWAGNPNEALIPSDGVAGWLWKTDGRILIQFQNGTAKMVVDASGNLGVGTATPLARMHVLGNNTTFRVESANAGATDTQIAIVTPNRQWNIGQNVGGAGIGALQFFDVTGGACRMMLDQSGNLFVGGTAGNGNAPNAHRFAKVVSQAQGLLAIDNNDGTSALFLAVEPAGNVSTAVPAAVLLGRNTGNGRSVNATGTVNASGADYAEYMVKAAGCGTIAPGDVCGIDRDGKLTKTWADAISFVVKSTEPSLVGGDTWAAHLRPRPVDPGEEPQPPALPTVPAEEADDAEVAAYQERLAAYPSRVAQHRVDHDAWAAATAAYARDLPAWEAELEAARVCVDRVAFCGQVPCNVTGDFEVGDYIVASASGAGIKAVAMKPDDITLPQYMRRIGKVWAVRDGRAWIDVQHG